jgi:hypothetical protein
MRTASCIFCGIIGRSCFLDDGTHRDGDMEPFSITSREWHRSPCRLIVVFVDRDVRSLPCYLALRVTM